ncbi:restriction endonuclease [Christensenella hongkongensis]|uniref:restriction endonuclease n=1 Tax=Christensenella hongkongensis TaxID=270498 RepID=UPI0026721100|nr:restriction endonuclease [Christensenella hongkongensis]
MVTVLVILLIMGGIWLLVAKVIIPIVFACSGTIEDAKSCRERKKEQNFIVNEFNFANSLEGQFDEFLINRKINKGAKECAGYYVWKYGDKLYICRDWDYYEDKIENEYREADYDEGALLDKTGHYYFECDEIFLDSIIYFKNENEKLFIKFEADERVKKLCYPEELSDILDGFIPHKKYEQYWNNKIDKWTDSLMGNSRLVEMIDNFLEKLGLKIRLLLNPYDMTYLLWELVTGTPSFSANDEIHDFKIDYYDMLIKVLMTEPELEFMTFIKEIRFEKALNLIDMSEEVLLNRTIYNLLWYCAVDKKVKEWCEKYPASFSNIDKLDTLAIVENFLPVRNDDIDDGDFVIGITCILVKNGKCKDNWSSYIDCHKEVTEIVKFTTERRKVEDFRNSLNSGVVAPAITLNDIDLMSGYEFEEFVAGLFKKMGYATEVTKASGDQGIDVLAKKNETIIGIQAKCYSSTVGNSAIQEAVAGKNYYNCDKAMVITNSTFTSAAKELAKSNNVILWDRDILKEKIQYRY